MEEKKERKRNKSKPIGVIHFRVKLKRPTVLGRWFEHNGFLSPREVIVTLNKRQNYIFYSDNGKNIEVDNVKFTTGW